MSRTIISIKRNIREYLEKYYINNKCVNRNINIYDLLSFYICNNEFIRFDICIYYLAIGEYYNENNIGYNLLKKMLLINKQKENIEKIHISEFVKNRIIDSNDKAVLDENYHIINGSKDIAKCFYNNVNEINILTIPTKSIKSNDNYSLDWLVENNFSNNEISSLLKISKKITDEVICRTYSCVLWPPVIRYVDNILEDLKRYCEIANYKIYTYSKEDFKKQLFDIYSCDDIEKWKIEKKYEYMNKYEPKICYIELKILAKYRIKSKTGLPISITGERIKKVVRSKYSKIMDNYYYDIVMHIADNKKQSEFIKKLFTND